MKSISRIVLLAVFSAVSVFGSLINNPSNWYQFGFTAEGGFLAVPYHTIQFGTNGTKFDYVQSGGQDVLFPFTRFSLEFNMFKNHSIFLLIQPLEVETRVLLTSQLNVDNAVFASNTYLNTRYGFTFYRASYVFYFFNNERAELGLGLSLQIRNANIEFASGDGTIIRSTRNIGPVPIIKAKARYTFDGGFFIGTEIDGFYASSSFFNGANYSFEGSILDASVRAGLPVKDIGDMFLNIRYLAGGARGTDQAPTPPADGYTENMLNTVSVTVGFLLR